MRPLPRFLAPALALAALVLAIRLAAGLAAPAGGSGSAEPRSEAGSAPPDKEGPLEPADGGPDPASAEAARTRSARTAARAAQRTAYPSVEVSPLPGWPRWIGEVNHQVSGLAFAGGHLYAVSDQSGVEKRALLEILLEDTPPSKPLSVRVVCRWKGGPNPDAEGLALDPPSGRPRIAVMALEAEADDLIEVGLDSCEYLGAYGPLAGETSNQGIEGVALSPDGRMVYLVHETNRTLLTLPRGGPGPARMVSKIMDADSLTDIAYDDRGTPSTDDDRLLLLDRNGRQILRSTLTGRVTGRWRLEQDLQKDPEGFEYHLVSLEGLALESREPDGSVFVYAATDTPPVPFPYRRKDRKDPMGLYARRICMLYRFRLPALPDEDSRGDAKGPAGGQASGGHTVLPAAGDRP